MSLAGVIHIKQAAISVDGTVYKVDADQITVQFEMLSDEFELEDGQIHSRVTGIRLYMSLKASFWTGSHDYTQLVQACLSNNLITVKPSIQSLFSFLAVPEKRTLEILKTKQGRRIHNYELSFKSKYKLNANVLSEFQILP